MDVPAPSATRVQQARVSVMVFFAGVGVLAATFVSRVPSVRDDLHVSPSEYGAVLLFGACGGLVAFWFTGGLVARLGSLAVGRACIAGIVAGILAMAGAALLGSPLLYGAGSFVALGNFEILMATLSAEAATIERLVGRPIMAQFHATFSLSMLAGLALGAGYSYVGASVTTHFLVNATLVGLVWLAVANRAFIDGRPPPRANGTGRSDFFSGIRAAVREPRTIALGFILLCAFTTELAAGNWIPLALVDDFARTEGTASVLYASVIIAQSLTRVLGVSRLQRWGRVATLRVCATLIAVGAAAFALSPSFAVVIPALLVWGVGTAFAFPVALSAAADERTDATSRVAAVNVFGTAGGLVAPLLVGVIAEAVGVRQALLLVCVAAAAIFTLAPASRPPHGGPSSSSTPALDSSPGSKPPSRARDGRGGPRR
ncbi:MFS transporter [Demequina sp. NBRC 110054]|uniref:MFS transporter n=1 Tax=Demequina sp. NBRC 110054 TaxID=1570343 RepID=UPI000A04A8DD|nr:MFS transporter [Demequina sp. NBRC 110054]